jgi:WD40 repeat protein
VIGSCLLTKIDVFFRHRHIFNSTVCNTVVNSLSISSDSEDDPSTACLYVSSNARKVLVYRLPSMELLSDLSFPFSINYSSVSPDGRFLAAVGDGPRVFLLNRQAGQEWVQNSELLGGSSDISVSCAWSESGSTLASAHQDGIVCVWDVRKASSTGPPMKRLNASQTSSSKGSCRNVKFSRGTPVDLLAFSEHTTFVHVVDARDFASEQLVRVHPSVRDHNVAGIAFSPLSKQLFVGLEDSLSVYDVLSGSRRAFGHFDLT